MIQFPNAKINLGLFITGRRPSGYHEIESLFYPVMIHDALELVPSDTMKIQVSGLPVSGVNLLQKAYDVLQADFSLPAVEVYLHKCIPIGAGLGGGSSDAAFFLQMLNAHAALGLTDEQLSRYAGKIGADCPFFLKNTPVIARGTGDELQPRRLDLSAYHIQVVYPGFQISTIEAYKNIRAFTPQGRLHTILSLEMDEWRKQLKNDFEPWAFQSYPGLKAIKERMYSCGASYASLSGSGSALFGIFEKHLPLPEWEQTGRDFKVFNV